MGIDAEILIRYRGERPSDEQLTRWSWDLCRAIGARHFFIGDGLPPEQYKEARDAWHEAFHSHPAYAQCQSARNNREEWQAEREKIVADIGEAPRMLRRAIELTDRCYPDDDDSIPGDARGPGMVWTQDGPPILAEPGETLLNVSLWTRYYGVGYERGDLLTICAVAEWIETNMQPCEVWYGGDSSGVLAEPFPDKKRRELRAHLFGQNGRDYFNYSGWAGPTPKLPPACGLCVPGEERRQQYGGGMHGNYAAVSCAGCGKNFETRDGGETWAEREES